MTWEVKITVFRDAAPHLTASFDRSPITLGARPYNDIVLNDPFVSGDHALVMVSRGELVYRDQSTNGSFFEGRKIEEQNLGQRGCIAIPPFEIEFAFEIEEEDTWKTAYRSDLSDLLPGRQPPAVRPAVERPAEPAAERPGAGKPTLTMDGGAVSRAKDERETLTPGQVLVAERQPPAAPPPLPPPAAAAGPLPPAAAAHDRFHLRVLAAPAELEGRVFALPARAARIGRGEACDVRLPVETISRSHAVLRPLGGDAYLLVDAGSANGCFVAGEQVKKAELADGDEFRLGDIDLQLLLDGSAAEPPVRPPASASANGEQRQASPPAPQEGLHLAVEPAVDDPSAVVVEVGGRVDSYNYTQVADALDGVIGDGARFLVVDLSGVHYIGHAGLGVLVKSLARLKPLGGDLRLVGLSQRLLDALSMSHLDSLFRQRLSASRQEALAAWYRS